MADNDSILGSLGTIAFWSAVGVAGKEGYKHFKVVQNAMEVAKTPGNGRGARKFGSMTPGNIATAFTPATETGFNKFTQGATSGFARADYSELAQALGVSVDDLKRELSPLEAKFGGLHYNKFGENIYDLSFMGNEGATPFAKMSYNGKIVHANTSSSSSAFHTSYVPSYYDYNVFDTIKNNPGMASEELVQTMSKNTIHPVYAQIKSAGRNVGGGSLREQRRALGKIRTQFSQDALRNISDTSANIYTNSVIPMINNGTEMRLNPHDIGAGTPTTIFDDAMRRVAGHTQIPTTFGVSKTNLAYSTYLKVNGLSDNVLNMYKSMSDIAGTSLSDGHKLNQFSSKASWFTNPETFANQSLKDLANAGANISPINSLFVPEGDAVFKQMLRDMPVAIPDIGKEGFFMNHSLANADMRTSDSLFVPLGDNMHGGNDLEALVNHFVTHSSNTKRGSLKFSKYTDSIQSFGVDQFNAGLLNQNSIQDAGKLAQFRKIRNEMFDGVVRSGDMKNILQEKPIDLSGFKGRDLNMSSGETGVTKWAGYKDLDINDVSFEEGGVRFSGQRKFKFKDTMGKVWGSIKAVATRNLSDTQTKRLFFNNLALEAKFDYKKLGVEGAENAKLAYMKNKGWHNSLKKEYTPMWDEISKMDKLMITHQHNTRTEMEKAVGIESNGDTMFNKMVGQESNAYKNSMPSLAEMPISDGSRTGFMRGMFSTDLHNSEYGYANSGHINSIMENRLRGSGLNSAADFIHQGFDREGATNMIEAFAPTADAKYLPKDRFVFNIDPASRSGYLNEGNIKKLYSSSADDALQLAMELAGTNSKVSAKTKFYIQASHNVAGTMVKTHVPIPTFESGYTSILNPQSHIYEEGTPLLKRLNSSTLRYVLDAKNGRDTAGSSWKTLTEEVSEFAGNFANYTTVPDRLAKTGGTVDSLIMNEDYMQTLVDTGAISETDLKGVLSEHGLERGGLNESYSAYMSDSRYNDLMSLYDASDVEVVNGRRRLKNDASYIISGRDPAYVHQGYTMNRAHNLDHIADDLASKMDASHAENFRRFVNDNTPHDNIHLSQAAMAAAGNDLDRDSYKYVAFTDPKLRSEAVQEFHTANAETFGFLQKVYGEKAGLKNGLQGSAATDIMSLTKAEAMGVGPIYNRAIGYTAPFTTYEDILKPIAGHADWGDVSVKRKGAILNHIFIKMPEEIIGAKGMGSEAAVTRLQEMLEANNPKKSAAMFIETYGDMKSIDGKRIMDLVTPEEMTGVFTKGKKLGDVWHSATVRGLKGRSFVDFMHEALGHGPFGNGAKDATSTFLNEAVHSMRMENKVSTTLHAVGDIGQDVLPKIFKNKWVRGLAATSLLAGFVMRGPQDHIQSQDAREESRPKQRPSGSDPIDPPGARVYQPSVGGYNVNIRGNTPRGIGAAQIGSQLQQMGMPVRNTFIDRNTSMDAHHIKSIQDEDRSNKWNG